LREWIIGGPEFAEKVRRDAPAVLARWARRDREVLAEAARAEARGEPPRLVFIHIMKTAGNALRRRLEQLVPPGTVRPEELGRPGAHPPEALLPWRLIAGHITAADAAHVPGPKRVFTVLREPKERLLSLYVFWSRHSDAAIAAQNLTQQRIARASTLPDFLRSRDPELRGNLHNAMTALLAGDYRYAGDGTYRHRYLPGEPRLTAAELLARALATLVSLDYVAFVDRLEEDRPGLMAALGLPDLGPLTQENTRDKVSDVLEPARPVEVTPEVDRELNRLTELDRILYRMARRHRGL
jgi:hypothetical protein